MDLLQVLLLCVFIMTLYYNSAYKCRRGASRPHEYVHDKMHTPAAAAAAQAAALASDP